LTTLLPPGQVSLPSTVKAGRVTCSGQNQKGGVAMRAVCLVLFAACAVLVSGGAVSAADEELASVGGKVIYNGKPLDDAVITFHLKDDQFVGAKIKDGKFRVDRVPIGAVKVTIDSKKVALPAKFADPETSGLSVEVKKGKNPVNFMISG
jgi:hypothetical protein